MTFSEKIQALRKQRNISQEQLAESMNVTRQAVSKWETGESLPDIDNIVRLSEILDVSIDYLLKDTPISDTKEKERYEDVSDEEEDDDCDDSFIIGNRTKLDIGKALYPVAVLIFFFVWSNPVVFVIAWVIDEIFDYLKKGKWSLSPYDVAIVVFLILGFGLNLWSYAWLVFIAAWVLDEIIVR